MNNSAVIDARFPPLKRKRIVTTCKECYRRKQKCDRARPCNICVARNVPEKCFYDDGDAHGEIKEDNNLSNEKDATPQIQGDGQDQKDAADSLSKSALHFSLQVGYSPHSVGNAFVGLQKTLNGKNGSQDITGASHRTTFLNDTEKAYCNLVKQLPPDLVCRELTHIYFSQANWLFNVLEKYYFDQLHKSWKEVSDGVLQEDRLDIKSRDVQYFPALLFQVLSVALQFLPPNTASAKLLNLKNITTCDQISSEYSTAGMNIINLLGRHNSVITAVQHDLMRAVWLKNCSRGTESWYSLGDAIRQAQDLGLHLQSPLRQVAGEDISDTLNRVWYDEFKRRLWTTLFIWDSHMALILGLPRTVNANDCTIRRPMDCEFPENPSKTVPMVPNADDKPSPYSGHMFLYGLAQNIHELLSLGADKPHLKDYSVVKMLHDQMAALLHNLPPAVRPENPDTSWDSQCPHLPKQRLHISGSANSYLVALHRPHAATHTESRQAAVRAAIDCLDSQQRLFDLVESYQYKIYTLSFYTIDAGIFLSATMIENPSLDRILSYQIYGALRQAVARLNIMGPSSKMATSGAQIISICCKKLQELFGIDDAASQGYVPSRYDAAPYVANLPTSETLTITEDLASRTQNDAFDWSGTHSLHDAQKALFSGIAPMPDFTSFSSFGEIEEYDPGAPLNDSIWNSLLG